MSQIANVLLVLIGSALGASIANAQARTSAFDGQYAGVSAKSPRPTSKSLNVRANENPMRCRSLEGPVTPAEHQGGPVRSVLKGPWSFATGYISW
jgi:hypothetical protein